MAPSWAELLAPHAAPIRGLSESLREFILQTVGDLEERVNPGWHSLSFRDGEGGYVFGLFPFEDRVHVLFEHGARLNDPDGLLEGTDKRQVRYVVLRPGRRLPRAGLRRLLQAAVHEARTRRATGRPLRASAGRNRRSRKRLS